MSDRNNEEQEFKFDKFMKDFEDRDQAARERSKERMIPDEENLNLEYFRRYQEDWRNSTKWRG